MLKEILLSKKSLIVLGFIAVVAFTLSLIKPKLIPPVLLSSNPQNNQAKVSTILPVELKFKEKVSNNEFTVTSVPETSWVPTQKDETTILLTHPKQLMPAKQYLLTISWNGTEITKLSFTTEDTQQDYEVIKNVKDEITKNYPLAKLMPLETSNFRVIYSEALTLEITIKNPNLTSAEVIEEVKSWVTQNGGNTSAHKYVIATPSPTPTN